jgi:predicted RNase H-like HicB family nuclease
VVEQVKSNLGFRARDTRRVRLHRQADRKSTRTVLAMKQRYHTIIRPERTGWFVGWVEEIPGTITQGRSLEECRRNLREALQLMLETHRDEARLGMNRQCILESIEIDVSDEAPAPGAALLSPLPTIEAQQPQPVA